MEILQGEDLPLYEGINKSQSLKVKRSEDISGDEVILGIKVNVQGDKEIKKRKSKNIEETNYDIIKIKEKFLETEKIFKNVVIDEKTKCIPKGAAFIKSLDNKKNLFEDDEVVEKEKIDNEEENNYRFDNYLNNEQSENTTLFKKIFNVMTNFEGFNPELTLICLNYFIFKKLNVKNMNLKNEKDLNVLRKEIELSNSHFKAYIPNSKKFFINFLYYVKFIDDQLN